MTVSRIVLVCGMNMDTNLKREVSVVYEDDNRKLDQEQRHARCVILNCVLIDVTSRHILELRIGIGRQR